MQMNDREADARPVSVHSVDNTHLSVPEHFHEMYGGLQGLHGPWIKVCSLYATPFCTVNEFPHRLSTADGSTTNSLYLGKGKNCF